MLMLYRCISRGGEEDDDHTCRVNCTGGDERLPMPASRKLKRDTEACAGMGAREMACARLIKAKESIRFRIRAARLR